jgi:hypothetical protein
VLSKSRIFKFLKRDCGTIPVAEITSGKIEIFSKHQRFLIATDSSKYLLIFVLYVCIILCEFGTEIIIIYYNIIILLSVMATGGTIDLCAVCENSLEEEKPILKCSGVCEFTCHLECSTLKKAEYKVLENTNFAWFCDKCKFREASTKHPSSRLMHINIQCLKNKCNELILFLRDNNNIDIITVNEHWLKPDELVYMLRTKTIIRPITLLARQ